MTRELRVLRAEDWDHWYGVLETAFGGAEESPEQRAMWRDLTELDRSLGVWEDGRCVGTAGAFSFRLTVPGGTPVAAAGVTMVGVLPTHRRRGVLTSMMRRQLDDVRERGEPLAVLTASEPAIYGRFGYGQATTQAHLEIDTARARPADAALPEGTDAVRLRLADPADAAARAACEEVYARLVPTRPGMLARLPGWERLPFLDPEAWREGGSPLQLLLAEGPDGQVTGYARYHVVPGWEPAGPTGRVALRDLDALDPASYAALWRQLLDLDLVTTLKARNRPADDPLLHLVPDIRRCNVRHRDSLHVRPVDVGAALAARTYAAPVDVVFEVTDAFCPWNEGRWRLSGDAKGASCERTSDAADLALSVRELGSAYLGGVGFAGLA
ncbi:GNAT family N-acetyltransferase, partial [Streptomyces sp. URMC 123]|uniref:GNAT family N-acetyltransferase n=1 Tax=Streptomyces sp. URMC 123 TaxID=3423403 RepID=UPI003F1A2CD5